MRCNLTIRFVAVPLMCALWLCALGLMTANAVAAAEQELGLTVGKPTAVSTFECVGIVLPFQGDDNRNAKCEVAFRRAGTEEPYRPGLDLFVDHRTNWGRSREFRGSIVHLRPGTAYEIRLTYSDPDGGSGSTTLSAQTWAEGFPTKKVLPIAADGRTAVLSESGSPEDGYVVYDGGGQTIDAAELDDAVQVAGNYIVVRNLKIVDPKRNGIAISPGCHDIVIEDCEITGWGPPGENPRTAYGIVAQEGAERIVIQHCSIHHPGGAAKTWEFGHPLGPEAIGFIQSKGNHVIRYNALYSSEGRYFKDILGGSDDGDSGNLRSDSDVYGNLVSHTYDDALEIEGFNINVRIWGNVIFKFYRAIATASIGYGRPHGVDSSLGPQYFWRNIMYDGISVERYTSMATKIRGDGGYYFFHNTVMASVPRALEAPNIQRSPEVDWHGLVLNNALCSPGPLLTYTRPREKPNRDEWFFDYNLYAVGPEAIAPVRNEDWEHNGIFNWEPAFERVGEYTYYLEEGSRGIGEGMIIPNFSLSGGEERPDMGACERGKWFMRVGPHADKWEAPK